MKKAFSVLVVLFVSFQLNAQWVQNSGTYKGIVLSFAESGTNIFAGTADSGIYVSTNNGTNWKQVNYGLTNTYFNALAVNGNNIFAASPGGVYLSTNNGTNWTQVNNGLTNTNVLCFAVSGTNIFAGTRFNGGVYVSTNNGTNWTQAGLTNISVTSLAVSGFNIFAGTYGGGVFLSTNNGTNWTQVNNGLTVTDSTGIVSFAVKGTNIFAVTSNYYSLGVSGGVFLSTNNGTNWTQVNIGLTIFDLTVSGTNIFGRDINLGVVLSTNNGTNWINVSDNLNDFIEVLTVTATNIFVGTEESGVWMRPLSELTSVSNEMKMVPQEYTLFQNFPNPFNPSTVIKYAVPFESNVNIRFYNSLGQIVREVNEGNRQPGNYGINFSSSGLASGIYFYSIKAVSTNGKNDFSAVKKMILLK